MGDFMSFKIRKLSFEIDLSAITDLPIIAKIEQISEKEIEITIPHVEKLTTFKLKTIIDDVEKLLHCAFFELYIAKSIEYASFYSYNKNILKFMKENELL